MSRLGLSITQTVFSFGIFDLAIFSYQIQFMYRLTVTKSNEIVAIPADFQMNRRRRHSKIRNYKRIMKLHKNLCAELSFSLHPSLINDIEFIWVEWMRSAHSYRSESIGWLSKNLTENQQSKFEIDDWTNAHRQKLSQCYRLNEIPSTKPTEKSNLDNIWHPTFPSSLFF